MSLDPMINEHAEECFLCIIEMYKGDHTAMDKIIIIIKTLE